MRGSEGNGMRGWLVVALGLLGLVGHAASARAQAADFDDDFATEPVEAPTEGAPGAPAENGDEGFDDDFAADFAEEPKAPSEGADAAGGQPKAGAAEADFEDDFATDAKAGTEAAAGGAVSAVDDGVVDPFQDGYDTPGPSLRRGQKLRTHSTFYGLTGGIHVVDAAGGAEDSFRFALTSQLFKKDGFLVENDDASRVGGSLVFSITPTEYLELAASIVAYATSNDQEDPALFQVLGDTRVFVKGFKDIKPWLTLGGDLELALLNGVGDIGLAGRGTSVGLRANASADLRQLERKPLPLQFRYNLRYYFDNSSKLVDDVEDARYGNLIDPLPREDEYRHLLTNVERYAFTINRVDTLSMSFGVEAPLPIKERYHLHPLLEWSFGIPVNRQGYDCVYRPFDPDERDSCLANTGFSTRISTLTLGARFVPPVRGLSVMTAFDIATTGKNQTVRELAPNTPWQWLLGFTYTYDLVPPKPVVVTREVTVEAPPKKLGRVRGRAVEAETQTGIAGVVIRFQDHSERSSLLSGADGNFTTYSFEPGTELTLQLEAEEYEPATCEVALPEDGSDGETVCPMVPLPKQGSVEVVLRNDQDETLDGVTVNLRGGSITRAGVTNISGEVSFEDLPPDEYTVNVDPEGYLARRSTVDVEARETAKLDIGLVKKPEQSLVRLGERRITIKRKIQFTNGKAAIKIQSHPMLAEVADVLLRHPDIQRVEIQGHTDNRGGTEFNRELSQARADAVREWLIGAGVEPERLTAVGYGESNPLVPNITPANRARNRRVQFEIVERAQ